MKQSTTLSVIARGMIVVLIGSLAWYGTLFYRGIEHAWFSPRWTTDDALQQQFPFYEVLYPGRFSGDLLYEAMNTYLAPLHRVIGTFATLLTGSPIMAGHWIMALQLALSAICIVLAVRCGCIDSSAWKKLEAAKHSIGDRGLLLWSWIPALFALLWFIHSRALIQRMTGGLQRGWAPVIISAGLYGMIAGRRWLVIAVMLLGFLLNPPAALLVALAYGVQALWSFFQRDGVFRERIKPIRELILVAPLFLFVGWYISQKPDFVGELISYKQALEMPEMSRVGGRFSFVPFLPVGVEFTDYAMRVFMGRVYRTPQSTLEVLPIVVSLLILTLLILALRLKRALIPQPITLFSLVSCGIYLLSRVVAFKLFVPDRYLLYPIGIALIIGLSVGVWRIALAPESSIRRGAGLLGGVASLLVLASLIYWGSGLGLQTTSKGTLNYNHRDNKRGWVFVWISKNTPEDALFAGHPIHVDPLPLFGARKTYVTNETWHPFFTHYNEEIKRRMTVVFKALYATSAQEFLSLVQPEGITHFVFPKKQFTPLALRTARFHRPLDTLVQSLTKRTPAEYFARNLPLDHPSVVVFQDETTVVVNVAELSKLVQSGAYSEPTRVLSQVERVEQEQSAEESGSEDED
jgi:hypothetical protein